MFGYKIFTNFAGYVGDASNRFLGGDVPIHNLDPMRFVSYITKKRIKDLSEIWGDSSEMIK